MTSRHDRADHYWRALALACASNAYDKREDLARGLLLVEDDGILVYYDNNLPNRSMRVRELIADRFCEHLSDEGVCPLASATFPQSGPDDGRSLAIVLDAGEEDMSGVSAAWDRTANEHPFQEGERGL